MLTHISFVPHAADNNNSNNNSGGQLPGGLKPIGGGDENDIDVDQDEARNTHFGDKPPPDVSIMNAKNEDRTTSFFAQPGILAGECV